jgi:hypothetical protein
MHNLNTLVVAQFTCAVLPDNLPCFAVQQCSICKRKTGFDKRSGDFNPLDYKSALYST